MPSTTAVTSLDRITLVSDGTTVDFTTAKANVTAVVFPNGIITGGALTIQASQDSTNWVIVAVVPVETRPVAFNSERVAYRYWRASVADLVKGGGSVSCTFMEAG